MPHTDVLQPHSTAHRGLAAPPPTPNNAPTQQMSRHNSMVNEEALATFLEKSLRIPDLMSRRLSLRASKDHRDQFNVSLPVVRLTEQQEVFTPQKLARIAAESGAFELLDHGVPLTLMQELEIEFCRLFSSSEKQQNQQPYTEPVKSFCCSGDSDQEAVKRAVSQVWPEEDHEQFSELLCSYTDAMQKLATEVLQSLIEGFEIAEELKSKIKSVVSFSFESEVEHLHSSILSIQYFSDPKNVQISSDHGLVPFRKEPCSLLVTIGDVLQRWTEGKYRSVQTHQLPGCAQPSLLMTVLLVTLDEQ